MSDLEKLTIDFESNLSREPASSLSWEPASSRFRPA